MRPQVFAMQAATAVLHAFQKAGQEKRKTCFICDSIELIVVVVLALVYMAAFLFAVYDATLLGRICLISAAVVSGWCAWETHS